MVQIQNDKRNIDLITLKVAEKNRRSYRKLRQELEELTEGGVLMLHRVLRQ